jgi:hypothetical protein
MVLRHGQVKTAEEVHGQIRPLLFAPLRSTAARFALFACFRIPEVLLFVLFQGNCFLEHDL